MVVRVKQLVLKIAALFVVMSLLAPLPASAGAGPIPASNIKVFFAAPDDPNATCEAGPLLTWFVCDMVIDPALNFIDWTRDYIIIPFLQEKPLSTDNTAFAIWKAVNNIANIGLIIIFFLVIFGTALGFNNYTIKKILPRLIAAAVFIQISWYISAAIIDVGNILGQGLVAIINPLIGTPPKIDFTQAGIGGQGVLAGTAALGVGASIGVLGIGLTTIIGLGLSLLVVFFTLIFRKILILMLAVFSGFGYLLWVLPNTQNIGREILETQVRLSLMYPLIILCMLGGRLFAKVAEGAYGAGTGAIQSHLAHYLPQTGGSSLAIAAIPLPLTDVGSLTPFVQIGAFALAFLATGLVFKRLL